MIKAMDRIKVSSGRPWPRGVSKTAEGINIAIIIEKKGTPVLKIYQPGDQKAALEIDMEPYHIMGSLYSVCLSGIRQKTIEYTVYVDDTPVRDFYAPMLADCAPWGMHSDLQDSYRYRADLSCFNWASDVKLNIPYSQLIMYKLHVRGFTAHRSSKVRNKGTFKAVADKIPHFKALGINCLELMPVVDFNELALKQKQPADTETYLNYWGYGAAYYFAPKTAYAVKNPVAEFKEMVLRLHENGIEVVLEFNFTGDIPASVCLDCLRYWVSEYHIDGFHINGHDDLMPFIVSDPLLSDVKLMCQDFCGQVIDSSRIPEKRQLAAYRNDFLVAARRFLKGDEDSVNEFLKHTIKNDPYHGTVNYIANTNGFTLMDLVSYDTKHNEANDEDNRDGTDYNHSWNCGLEGPTRKKKISELRKRQIYNALILTIFSQGTPLIYAGDEFGNSQQGNNNAYCQDNEISWLNWNDLKKNQDIFDFLSFLIQLRKTHPVLHPQKPLRIMDYLSCGLPDLSIHGKKPWSPDLKPHSRTLALLYNGLYAQINGSSDDSFYFIYNMHWEEHTFHLPAIPNQKVWNILINTGSTCPITEDTPLKEASLTLKPRSIAIVYSRPVPPL